MVYYVARRGFLLDRIGRELSIIKNKARFVEEVCNEDLVVSNRKRKELLEELKELEYDLHPKDEDDDEQEDEIEEDPNEIDTSDADLAKGYEYLLGMKIWSLTHERAEELRRQRDEKSGELSKMKATLPEEMWLNDLDAVEALLDERDAALDIDSSRQQTFSVSEKKPRASKGAAKKAPAKGTKTARANAKKRKPPSDEWDSEQESDESDEVESDIEFSSEDEEGPPKDKPGKKKPKTAHHALLDHSQGESESTVSTKNTSNDKKPTNGGKKAQRKTSSQDASKKPRSSKGNSKDVAKKPRSSKGNVTKKGKASISLGLSPNNNNQSWWSKNKKTTAGDDSDDDDIFGSDDMKPNARKEDEERPRKKKRIQYASSEEDSFSW